tara:strand:+ start:689 stop:1108 length:420 start_codon:yes stop_codon:yes gene_type:complete
MGCSTCKKAKDKGIPEIDSTDLDVELIPKNLFTGGFSENILFKIIAFVVVTIAIPFIILILVGKMFLTFFMPKKLSKISNKLTGLFTLILTKYGEYKTRKTIKKRMEQFGNNRGYEKDSELVDIEVLDDIQVHDNNKKE